MTFRLYVAAGGGGDAIAAALLHDDPQTRPVILTYAWERLLLDPVPGPRSVTDFDHLDLDVPGLAEITTSTEARPPARSPLSRLSETLDARLFLLDPTDGAQGMREQVHAAVAHLQPDEVIVVDVGGDILARGDEPGLRSPLADALALAAVEGLDIPTRVLMAGPGLDGELTEAEALHRVDALGGHLYRTLTAEDTHHIGDALDWHPTEATRLLVAAAHGYRGTVEIRDQGSLVHLTDRSANVYRLDAHRVQDANPLARVLAGSRSLTEANDLTRDLLGRTELDYETTKAATRAAGRHDQPGRPSPEAISASRRVARQHGADYLTPRRLAETLNTTTESLRGPTHGYLLIPTTETAPIGRTN